MLFYQILNRLKSLNGFDYTDYNNDYTDFARELLLICVIF